jgi:phosphogluconate dehydratase
MIAIAQAAGIAITWKDLSELSRMTPLLARIYPNGKADVNHFHAAGGMGLLIRELLGAGLLHRDVRTIWGTGLDGYLIEPRLAADGSLSWTGAAERSGDEEVLRGCAHAFDASGGLTVLGGNIGHAVIKTSAVPRDRRIVEGPARIFDSQEDLQEAFRAGALDDDFIAVVRLQGPKANGMPELHKLLPPLGVLQDRGRRVALVTDGRMSGASGKVPAAIHVTPEAADGGPIGKLRDGDLIRLDAERGTLDVLIDAAELDSRPAILPDLTVSVHGVGRELFAPFRLNVNRADEGATIFRAA